MRRRFGYRRIHDLLRPQFLGVNHKRVHRLYRQANLAVRRRKKSKGGNADVNLGLAFGIFMAYIGASSHRLPALVNQCAKPLSR